jgi:ribosomal protein S14
MFNRLTINSKQRIKITHQELNIKQSKYAFLSILNEDLNKTYQQKNFLFKSTLKTYLRNICVFSGRNRGNYRLFRLSRMQTREFLNSGVLSNLQKSG